MKNTNDFSKCKVGDKLWSIQLGECKVIDVIEDLIECVNNKQNRNEYFFNGNNYSNDFVQSLFWSKPEIIAPEKSKEKIPFDLEKALSGEYDLITREGIYITEWKWFQEFDNRNKLLVIINNDLKMMKENGRFYCDSIECDFDLFLIEK